MKVTKTQSGHSGAASLQSQPAFQPIEIKIVIESLNELHIFKRITGSNCTNAAAMETAGTLRDSDVITASKMFTEMYNSLRDA